MIFHLKSLAQKANARWTPAREENCWLPPIAVAKNNLQTSVLVKDSATEYYPITQEVLIIQRTKMLKLSRQNSHENGVDCLHDCLGWSYWICTTLCCYREIMHQLTFDESKFLGSLQREDFKTAQIQTRLSVNSASVAPLYRTIGGHSSFVLMCHTSEPCHLVWHDWDWSQRTTHLSASGCLADGWHPEMAILRLW